MGIKTQRRKGEKKKTCLCLLMRGSCTKNGQKPPSLGNNNKGLFQFSAMLRGLIISP